MRNLQQTHLAKLLLALVAGVAIGFTVAAKAADTSSIPDVAPGIKAARDKINAGEYEAAVPMLSAVLKEKPADADALNLMGFSLRKIGKTTEALDYYGRALAIEPKHPGANEYLGELYVELGQLDRAKERLAILEASCGKNCEQSKKLADAIAKAPNNH